MKNKMIFFVFSLVAIIHYAFADIANDYADAEAYIVHQDLFNQLKNTVSHAPKILPAAPKSCESESYYQHSESISSKAAAEMSTPGSVGKVVSESAMKRSRVNIDTTSPEVKLAKKRQEQADEIAAYHRIYCRDGSCQSVSHDTNKDFGQSATRLNALSSAAEEVKKQGTDSGINPSAIRIFTGRAAHCREIALGSLNCCDDSGWAKGLAHCNSEEKILGQAKEKGDLVVYIGRYCSKKMLGLCTRYSRGYCIFPSRIAYDVQVSGRHQLHRSFGTGQAPECSGLSAEEISQIDFKKIDFSNVIHEVMDKVHLPNQHELGQHIEEQIKKAIQRKQ